jgi:hypothetical protein
MVDIERQIKLCIEDPVATTATLQNLLDTIDVTIDDVVAACCQSRPWKSLAAKSKVVEFFWSCGSDNARPRQVARRGSVISSGRRA